MTKLFSYHRYGRLLLGIFTRLPFVNGLSLLLLLSERAKRESYPPFPPTAIYAMVFLCVIIGSGMSANLRRRDLAIIYCGQLGYYIYLLMTSTAALKYKEWLLGRMVTRTLGTLGVYLYFAFLCDPPNGGQLRRLSQTCLGVYALARGYILTANPEEAYAVTQTWAWTGINAALATSSVWFVGAAFALSGLSLLLNKEWRLSLLVGGEGRALSLLMGCLVATWTLSEWNIDFWTKSASVDMWNHFRIVIDDLCVMLGAFIVKSKCTFSS